jgi:hypothetical protein
MNTAPGTSFTTLHFLMHRPNKLKRCITLGWKGFPGTNTLAYWPISKIQRKKYLWIQPQGPHLQPFIFFMHQPNKLKCCIRLGWKGFQGTNTLAYSPISKIQRKKYLWIQPQGPHSQPFIFSCIVPIS